MREQNIEFASQSLKIPKTPDTLPSDGPSKSIHDESVASDRDARLDGMPRSANWHGNDAATQEGRKIFIAGLPEDTSQEDLQDCFSQIGTIASCELKKGYGFVVGFDSFALPPSYKKITFLFLCGTAFRRTLLLCRERKT